MGKQTALIEEHLKLGAKIVEFGGWDMPVQYSGLAAEHEACRTTGGLFDVSHMGEVRVKGARALEFLNSIVTNDVSKMKDGQAQYSAMCYPHGGCVDDLIIHRIDSQEFFICVNASNTDKDFDWIHSHAFPGVSVTNESPLWSQIAVQGRISPELVSRVSNKSINQLKYYHFERATVLGETGYVARTGYTGEDGFEIYVPWKFGPALWQELLKMGSPLGLLPCGLGARDTLRTEMKYPLYGHEIDENRNPLEAGLGWVTKFDKGDFIGRDSLLSIKEKGLNRSLVGLKSLGRGIPRQGYKIFKDMQEIGEVTSGTFSPSLKQGIAIASVKREFAKIGTRVDLQIREQLFPHEVVETPFYKRPY